MNAKNFLLSLIEKAAVTRTAVYFLKLEHLFVVIRELWHAFWDTLERVIDKFTAGIVGSDDSLAFAEDTLPILTFCPIGAVFAGGLYCISEKLTFSKHDGFPLSLFIIANRQEKSQRKL